jgi:hypothetical protein
MAIDVQLLSGSDEFGDNYITALPSAITVSGYDGSSGTSGTAVGGTAWTAYNLAGTQVGTGTMLSSATSFNVTSTTSWIGGSTIVPGWYQVVTNNTSSSACYILVCPGTPAGGTSTLPTIASLPDIVNITGGGPDLGAWAPGTIDRDYYQIPDLSPNQILASVQSDPYFMMGDGVRPRYLWISSSEQSTTFPTPGQWATTASVLGAAGYHAIYEIPTNEPENAGYSTSPPATALIAAINDAQAAVAANWSTTVSGTTGSSHVNVNTFTGTQTFDVASSSGIPSGGGAFTVPTTKVLEVVQTASQGTWGSDGSSMLFGGEVSAGDTVIAAIWGGTGETVTGAGVTFTQQTTADSFGTLYSGSGASGGVSNVTVSGLSIWAGSALDVSGITGSPAVVANPVNTGDGSSCSITITPTAAGQFVVAVCSGNNNVEGGTVPSSPWTVIDTGTGTIWAWMISTGTSPVTATFTFGTGTFNASACAAVYDTGGSTSGSAMLTYGGTGTGTLTDVTLVSGSGTLSTGNAVVSTGDTSALFAVMSSGGYDNTSFADWSTILAGLNFTPDFYSTHMESSTENLADFVSLRQYFNGLQGIGPKPWMFTETGMTESAFGVLSARRGARQRPMFRLIAEMYGWPKELCYDFPIFDHEGSGIVSYQIEPGAGGGNIRPGLYALRVMAEALYKTSVPPAKLSFGPSGSVGDSMFVGAHYTGTINDVVVLATNGLHGASVILNVPGYNSGNSITMWDGMGVPTTLTVSSSKTITIPLNDLLTYVFLTPSSTVSVSNTDQGVLTMNAQSNLLSGATIKNGANATVGTINNNSFSESLTDVATSSAPYEDTTVPDTFTASGLGGVVNGFALRSVQSGVFGGNATSTPTSFTISINGTQVYSYSNASAVNFANRPSGDSANGTVPGASTEYWDETWSWVAAISPVTVTGNVVLDITVTSNGGLIANAGSGTQQINLSEFQLYVLQSLMSGHKRAMIMIRLATG